MINVGFKKLDERALIPEYKTEGSAGFDFHAVVDKENKWYDQQYIHDRMACSLVIPPKEQCIVKTGLAVELPDGFELQVRPRSGLAFKRSITVTNSPGTVDSDYKGEIMIILLNLGKEDFTILDGDRIAQGVVKAVPDVNIVEVQELSKTDRGSGGFGSTGSN